MDNLKQTEAGKTPPILSGAAGKTPPVLPSVPPSSSAVPSAPSRRVPKSKISWWLTPCILTGILFLGILMSVARHGGLGATINLNGKPEVKALRNLCAVNLSSQPSQAQALCTPRGLALAQQLSEGGKFRLATFSITSLKANPSLTDVQMVRDTADGKTVVFARMVDQSGWKFDDVYMVEAKGQPLNFWMSDANEHPFITAAGLVDWNKAMANASDILDLYQKFKQTFGDESR